MVFVTFSTLLVVSFAVLLPAVGAAVSRVLFATMFAFSERQGFILVMVESLLLLIGGLCGGNSIGQPREGCSGCFLSCNVVHHSCQPHKFIVLSAREDPRTNVRITHTLQQGLLNYLVPVACLLEAPNFRTGNEQITQLCSAKETADKCSHSLLRCLYH